MGKIDRRAYRVNQKDVDGLKFIRMILASYCIAVSIGMIEGFDPAVFFNQFLTPIDATITGSTIVFTFAAFLFLGFFLRLASLYLAMVILCASISTYIGSPLPGSLDVLWRDIVIASALLLNYWSLDERTRERQSLFRFYKAARRIAPITDKIIPARVKPSVTSTRRAYDAALKLSKAEFQRRSVQKNETQGTLTVTNAPVLGAFEEDMSEEELKNLFV
jgi:hypothetical protein